MPPSTRGPTSKIVLIQRMLSEQKYLGLSPLTKSDSTDLIPWSTNISIDAPPLWKHHEAEMAYEDKQPSDPCSESTCFNVFTKTVFKKSKSCFLAYKASAPENRLLQIPVASKGVIFV